MADIRVKAGGRVAILSHCLLNQNVKPYLRARYPGVVPPVLDLLVRKGFALFQLPCPEVSFTGLNRWSAVIEQYDTPKYRRHCRELAVQTVDQLAQYPQYGYRCVLMGIDGSPSCGICLAGSSRDWRGYPGTASLGERYPIAAGQGVFMQELLAELRQRGLETPPVIGVGLDIHGIDLDTLPARLEAQLAEAMPE